MLSDSCHEAIESLLEVIVMYDYCDDYKAKLIHIIRKLNDIRDDLDRNHEGHLLINDKEESLRIARKMYKNAQTKRTMSSFDFYDNLFPSD